MTDFSYCYIYQCIGIAQRMSPLQVCSVRMEDEPCSKCIFHSPQTSSAVSCSMFYLLWYSILHVLLGGFIIFHLSHSSFYISHPLFHWSIWHPPSLTQYSTGEYMTSSISHTTTVHPPWISPSIETHKAVILLAIPKPFRSPKHFHLTLPTCVVNYDWLFDWIWEMLQGIMSRYMHNNTSA
jgi:hypothetical protein